MAPVPLVLTLAQKEQYYKEYSTIVNQLNEEYGTGFKLDPITTFSADYWLELNDFEDMLKEESTLHLSWSIISKFFTSKSTKISEITYGIASNNHSC